MLWFTEFLTIYMHNYCLYFKVQKVKWLTPITSLVNSGEAEPTPLNATPRCL